MLCTDTVSFWIKGLCQKAELVARNDCKYFPTFNFSFSRSICVFPIDFNFLEFVASEAHKSCSASVDIHIKASLSWATWHGTHIVEAQSYDMWAQFLLLSPTFEDLMCWLYVFRFIIYVNILNAKACWLSSKWFTEFQD